MALIEKIVSGGQTGADRAALDFAIENGIPHGGWCPKGRMAEDGALGSCYLLQETPLKSYPQRTEWNVRDSDGTVVFSISPTLTGGTKKTFFLANLRGKPVLRLAKDGGGRFPHLDLLEFIERHHVKVMNVAGPRSSKEPEVYSFVKEVLQNALLTKPSPDKG